MNALADYLKEKKCKGLKPIPRVNEAGCMIEWYWKDVLSVQEPIYHEGKWIGSILKSEDGKVVGVQIHMEAIDGYKIKVE